MVFPTFVPPASGTFSTGATEDHEPRVLTAKFGDGYVQEAGDGLNADLMKMSVSWEALTPEEGQTVMDFFADLGGYRPFKFTLPGEGVPRKFKCRKWSRRFSSFQVVDISASWEEVANPE